jgi:hypothetical protein
MGGLLRNQSNTTIEESNDKGKADRFDLSSLSTIFQMKKNSIKHLIGLKGRHLSHTHFYNLVMAHGYEMVLAVLHPKHLRDRPLMSTLLHHYCETRKAQTCESLGVSDTQELQGVDHSHSYKETLWKQAIRDATELRVLEFAFQQLVSHDAHIIEDACPHVEDAEELACDIFRKLALINQKNFGAKKISSKDAMSEEVGMPPQMWVAAKDNRLRLLSAFDGSPQFFTSLMQEYLSAQECLSKHDLSWLGWGLVAPHHEHCARFIGKILANTPADSTLFVGGKQGGKLGMICVASGNSAALFGLLHSDAVLREPLGDAQRAILVQGFMWNPYQWNLKLALLASSGSGLRIWLCLVFGMLVFMSYIVFWFWLLGIGISMHHAGIHWSLCAVVAALDLPWVMYIGGFVRLLWHAANGDHPISESWKYGWSVNIVNRCWNLVRILVVWMLDDPDSFPIVDIDTPEGAALTCGSVLAIFKLPYAIPLLFHIPLWHIRKFFGCVKLHGK